MEGCKLNDQSPGSSNIQTMSTARTRDGLQLSYKIVPGTGKGRCVLIHSLAMDKAFWAETVRALAGSAEVLVYDCRGHGLSGKLAEAGGAFSVAQFADDLADLMDHVGWSSAVVAGASMGGCVALAFAAAYPQRVDGLGLFDTTAFYGDNAPTVWAERAEKAQKEGLGALVGFQKTRWFGDAFREANPDIVDALVAVFLANDLKSYMATCNMLGAADLRPALPTFDFPCRIAVGSEDYATPVEMARNLADNIPGATMSIIEGARHFTPLEVPAVIAENLQLLIAAAKA
jgi:3-oxoadipate enol-lactonase